MSYAVK